MMENNLRKPQSWSDCDRAIHEYITGFVDLLQSKLAETLVGVYLHGSLAMGSYFPPKSDMDFIIVSANSLCVAFARELNIAIARYADIRPTAGSIECSVITFDTARNVPDKMPYELHYSETEHQRILDGQVTYGVRQIDPDLPAHLMCVKKRGVCLSGMAIEDAFGDVNRQNFVRAVMTDFNWIAEGENICESPYYGVLNICRVLQMFNKTGDEYLSKYEGAIWAIENLPVEFTPMIQKALDVYSSDALVDESGRKTGGVVWDKTALLAFRDYAVGIYRQITV